MPYRLAVLLTLAVVLIATPAFARADDSENPWFGWALVSKGSTVATSVVELNRLNEWTSDEDRVLFARFGEDEYVIRDRMTLDRADDLLAPIRELGEKARQIAAYRGANRRDKREWKERLRPFKQKRRELLLQVSGEIESLARDAIRRGQAQRLN